MKVKEAREKILKAIKEKAEKNTDWDFFKEEDDYKKALEEIINISDEEEITKEELKEELENARNNISELADNLTDVYTSDLLKWYLEDEGRVFYMGEAISELGAEDGFKVLSGGQYLYWEEIIDKVLNVADEIF